MQGSKKFGHVRGEPVRFIRGHVAHLKRRETLGPDLWLVTDTGYTTPCWLCVLAPQDARGYMKVSLRGRSVSAHRAMYEQEVGPIPDGLTIDHLCRQPSCMNPSHLEVVTYAENVRRGRFVKLTMEVAREIRASDAPAKELAARYGVDRSQISAIRAGTRWRE